MKPRRAPTMTHVFEELEPRIMYSADFAPNLADDAGWMPQAELRTLDQDVPVSGSANVAERAHEILFVDARVADYEQLIDEFAHSRPAGNAIEIVVIDADRDGIEQIGHELAQRDNLAAVHIISHGSAASLQLGATSLDAASLPRYSEALQRWGEALGADGDILLYGCDVAADENGRAFVQQISQITGADVAASTDLTGNREFGGDWDLELRAGAIESIAVGYENLEIQWSGALATININANLQDKIYNSGTETFAQLQALVSSGSKVSLREAIIAANSNGTADEIILSAGTYSLSLGSDAVSAENNPTTGDLDVVESLVIRGAGAGQTVIDGSGNSRVFQFHAEAFPRNATIADLTIRSGSDAFGGGISVQNNGLNLVSLALDKVWMLDNKAVGGSGAGVDGFGGAIYSAGLLTITNSLIGAGNAAGDNGNSATAFGGGIASHGSANANVTLTNVTITGNTAANGGGLYISKAGTLENVTVTANTASTSGGGIYEAGWGVSNQITNTIVIANSAGSNTAASGPDVYALVAGVTGDGNNIFGTSKTNSNFALDPTDIQSSTSASWLGALALNGALIPTHALLSGSPAIDAGNDTGAPLTDQRGIARIDFVGVGAAGVKTDIGAFEFTGGSNFPSVNTVPAQSGNEDVQFALSGISVSDANLSSVELHVSNGKLSAIAAGGATVTGDLTNTLLISGNQAQVNNTLTSLKYQGNLNFSGIDSVTVTSTDSSLVQDVDSATITVNPVNDAPVLVSNVVNNVNEGAGVTIAAAQLTVSDVDNAPAQLTYTVTAIPTNGTLRLNGIALAANSTFTQADINANLITYLHNGSETTTDTFTFTVSDGAGGTIGATAHAVMINPVNDPLGVTTNAGLTLNEGASAPITNAQLSVSDVDNSPAQLTYTVTAIPTNGAVRLNGTALALNGTFTQADINAGLVAYLHNGSETASDGFIFTVSDGAGGSIGASNFAFTVTPVNDAPTTSGIANVTVTEDAAPSVINLFPAFADVEDADPALTYTIASNTNSTLFAGTLIDNAGGTLMLSYAAQQSGSAAITVRATDSAGLFVDTTFAVAVNEVNDAPLLTHTALTLNEGSASTITNALLQAADVDNTPTQLVYSVGAIPANGVLRLNGTALAVNGTFTQDEINNNRVSYVHSDSETSNDSFTFTLSDGAGATIGATNFVVTVNPFNDNNPVIISNGAGASAAINVAENAGAVTTVTATDADLPAQTLAYSISGGADAARFAVNAVTGALSFATTPDFESPADADGNNVYEVSVQVADGLGRTDTQAISVTVTNVNEGGVSAIADTDVAANNVNENTALGTVVGITANASDLDTSDTISYALDDDAGGRFAIDAASGVVTVAGALDYEAGTSHNIIVRASSTDGSASTRSFTINLADQNDNAPVIGAGQVFVSAENAAYGTRVGVAGAVDADSVGTLQNWAITGGTGASAFAINASTGEITVADANQLDFETSASFSLQLSVADGTNTSAAQSITINLTNVNEAPGDLILSGGAVAEGSANASAVGGVNASDADTGDTFSYSLLDDAGGRFVIDANGGLVSVANGALLDFETNAVHNITVRVRDAGALSYDESFAINVTNVNEAPVNSVPAAQTVSEDTTFAFTGAEAISVIDPEGNLASVQLNVSNGVLGVSLLGGASVSAGAIGTSSVTLTGTQAQLHAALGSISYQPGLDFIGSDTLNIVSTDSGGLADNDAIAINVVAINDAPVLNDQSFTVAENSANDSAVGSVAASDMEAGATLSYSIVSGNTDGAFAIDAATGALTVANSAALNFEATPTFNLVVQVTDSAGASDTAAVTITLSNADEAPFISAIADHTIDEDGVSAVLSFAVGDEESAAGTLTVQATSSNAAIIDASGIVLGGSGANRTVQFTPVANANGGPVTITLEVSDGVNTTQTAFDVTVLAVNDAPALTANALTVAEGATVTLSNAQINSVDSDSAAAQLRYTVSELSGGRFELSSNPSVAVQSFTQDDIDAQRVRFVHDGGEAAPSYRLSVGDSNAGDGPVAATVSFENVNDAPVLTTANGAQLGPSGALSLNDALLAAADADHAATQLVYTIVEAPRAGQLELSTNPGVAVTAFTQADIDAGRLRYVASTGALRDNFTLLVSDGSSSSAAATFLIQRAELTLPPVNVPERPDADTALPPDPLTIVGETAATSVSATPELENQTPGRPLNALPSVAATTAAEPDASLTPNGDALRALNAPAAAEPVRVASTDATPRRLRDAPVVALKTAPVVVRESEQTLLAAGAERARAIEPDTDLADSGYVEQLNKVRDQIQAQLELDQSVLGSSIALSTGLSVGYVIWVLRAGVLVSSLLSALPAWGAFDPLPVLGKLKDDDEDQDESLQDMVRRVRRGAPGTPSPNSGAAAAESTGARFLESWSAGGR